MDKSEVVEAFNGGYQEMGKKEERFEVVFTDGSQMKDSGVRQILL